MTRDFHLINSHFKVRTFAIVAMLALVYKFAIVAWGVNHGIDLVDESFNYLLLNSPHQYPAYIYTTLICGTLPGAWLGHISRLRLVYLGLELFSTAILFWAIVKWLHKNFASDNFRPGPYLVVFLFFVLSFGNGRIENYINYHTLTAHLANIIWALLLIMSVSQNRFKLFLTGAVALGLVFTVFVLKTQSGIFLLLLSSFFIYKHIKSISGLALMAISGGVISAILLLQIQSFDLWKTQIVALFDYTSAMGYLSSRFPIQYILYDLLPLCLTLVAAAGGYYLFRQYGLLSGMASFILFGVILFVAGYCFTDVPFSYFLMVYAAFPIYINLLNVDGELRLYAGALLLTPFLLSVGTSSFLFEIAVLSSPLWLAGILMLVCNLNFTRQLYFAVSLLICACLIHFSIMRVIAPYGYAEPLWSQNIYSPETGQYIDKKTARFISELKKGAKQAGIPNDAKVILTVPIMGINHVLNLPLPPYTVLWCFPPCYQPENVRFFKNFPQASEMSRTFVIGSTGQEKALTEGIKGYLKNKEMAARPVAYINNDLFNLQTEFPSDSFVIYRVVPLAAE